MADKILITGGLGYVGGRIAQHLARSCEGSITLMTRRPLNLVPEWAKGFEVIQEKEFMEGTLRHALDGIDTVIHLAAVNEIESEKDPDLALEINGRGTYRLLRACLDSGVQRFIYFSTYHVYGPSANGLVTELTPTRPVHPYAITHRLAEDFTNWFHITSRIEILIFRLSNGYGHPVDSNINRWTLVFNDLCMQAVQNGKIVLKSTGRQQRDFISLKDVARAVSHFLGLPKGQWHDGLFNLGGECSLSILEAAQRIALNYQEHYNRSIEVEIGSNVDQLSNLPFQYCVDKLKMTGFSLLGCMDEEIKATFDVVERMCRPA